MSKLIKIDKRNNKEGYSLLSGDGFTHIMQGGNGHESSLITLSDDYLQGLLADLESIIDKRAEQLYKRVS